MIKRIFFSILMLCIAISLQATCRTSQTFMYYRPLTHNVAAIEQGWAQLIAHKDEASHSAFQVVGIYQKGHSKKDARYFLLNCKEDILIAGDDTPFAGTRDVRAEWLNLPSNFSGNMTLYPHQEQGGAILCFNQDLRTYISWELFQSWWFDFRMPIYFVKNNLCLTQYNIKNPATGFGRPHDILQAMSSFPFAAMDNRSRKKFGVSDISLGLGATFLANDDFILTYQTAVVIPTSGKASPEHIFSPFLANNGQLGLRYGFNFEMPLQEKESLMKSIFFLTMDNFYYFKTHQVRTFDLRHKQWSRYMQFRNLRTGEVVPGVDILTQRVCVKSHNFIDLSTGFKFRKGFLEFEAGYDLWAHSSEKIYLACPPCEKGTPLIHQYAIAGAAGGFANQSTIFNLAPNDPEPRGLFENDIDPVSGAGRGGYTNKLHMAFSFHKDSGRFPCMASLGGFYEHAGSDVALNQWGGWLKFVGEI